MVSRPYSNSPRVALRIAKLCKGRRMKNKVFGPIITHSSNFSDWIHATMLTTTYNISNVPIFFYFLNYFMHYRTVGQLIQP